MLLTLCEKMAKQRSSCGSNTSRTILKTRSRSGSFKNLKAWLASDNEGWLLLDSVDEARLENPSDFELAIRKLGGRVSAAQQRVHIVITGRTVAWRPKTDLEHCTRHLPYEPPSMTAVPTNDEPTEGASEGNVHTEDRPEAKDRLVFKIVALNDLAPDQIEYFAAAKGIKDTQAFLDAVERADAQAFTARPQDLQELVEFWNDRGQIGSRLEVMQQHRPPPFGAGSRTCRCETPFS